MINMDDYKGRNFDLCKKAVSEYRTNPAASDGIMFNCYNEEEVNEIRKIMEKLAPDVKCYFHSLFP
jgi:hypothetical protein